MPAAHASSRTNVDQLGTAFARQVAELERLEPEVRRASDPEAVHDMRVAVRRLRSMLRTGRPLLARDWVDDLRGELRWIADLLGAVRDQDVLSQRLHEQAGRLSGGDSVVSAQLLRPLRAERERARAALIEALDQPRYVRLRSELASAARALPASGDDRPLADLAARELTRLRKRGMPAGDASSAALHKLRIRAKRARYAAELVERSDGPTAARFVREAKRFQDLLGRHQDAVVARRHLRRLARATARVDTAVVAGRLIQLQEQELDAVRRDLPTAWKRLSKHAHRARAT